AAAVKAACKIALRGSLAQVGLALASSIGAWLNLALVVAFASRQGHFAVDPRLRSALTKLAAAGLALALALWLAEAPVARLVASWTSWRDEGTLAALAAIGALVYGATVLVLFGPQWLASLRARKTRGGPVPAPPLAPLGGAAQSPRR